MLTINNLSAAYSSFPVLENINLQVQAGETVSVLGANTAGKSTLLRSISGLVPHVKGEIVFQGTKLLTLPPQNRASLGIAHVPEGRHVFPGMSVKDNLWMGAYSCRSDAGLTARMEEILVMFPRLRERFQQLAGTLSGGEQQMVAIGRALMSNPKLLLLDEPSHGLAPVVVDEVHTAIEAIASKGVAVLLVEQNAALALQVASRGLVLESGRIAAEGSSKALQKNPNVRKAYLGI